MKEKKDKELLSAEEYTQEDLKEVFGSEFIDLVNMLGINMVTETLDMVFTTFNIAPDILKPILAKRVREIMRRATLNLVSNIVELMDLDVAEDRITYTAKEVFDKEIEKINGIIEKKIERDKKRQAKSKYYTGEAKA